MVIPAANGEESKKRRKLRASTAVSEKSDAMGQIMSSMQAGETDKVQGRPDAGDDGDDEALWEILRIRGGLFTGLKVHLDYPESDRKKDAIRSLIKYDAEIHHEPKADTTHIVTTGASDLMRLHGKNHGTRLISIDFVEASLRSGKLAPINLYNIDRLGELRTNNNGHSRQAPELQQEGVMAWLEQQQRHGPKPQAATSVFKGLTISVTSGGQQERDYVFKLVHQHGGAYAHAVDDEVTHLIAFSCNGKRFQEAHKARPGLNVVSAQWLRDCVTSGKRQDEHSYKPVWSTEGQGEDELQLLKSSQNSIVAPPSNQQHAKRLAAESLPGEPANKSRRISEPSPSARPSQRVASRAPANAVRSRTVASVMRSRRESWQLANEVRDSQQTEDDAVSISTQTTAMSLPHGGTPESEVKKAPNQARPLQREQTHAVDIEMSDHAVANRRNTDDTAAFPAKVPIDGNILCNPFTNPASESPSKQPFIPATTPTPGTTAPATTLPTPPQSSSQGETSSWTLPAIIPTDAKKIYAVRRGKQPGFYFTHSDTYAQILEYPNNLWRTFKNSEVGRNKALAFINHEPAADGSCEYKCQAGC